MKRKQIILTGACAVTALTLVSTNRASAEIHDCSELNDDGGFFGCVESGGGEGGGCEEGAGDSFCPEVEGCQLIDSESGYDCDEWWDDSENGGNQCDWGPGEDDELNCQYANT
jgi:hypothetical protein